MSDFDSDTFNADEFSVQIVSPEIRMQMIAIYHDEVALYLKQAHSALRDGNAEQLHNAAHSLKGVVGNYLGTKAFAAATELDRLARKEELEAAEKVLIICEQEVEALGKALLDYRSSL